jgi:uncharacterized protein YwgA
MKRRQREALVAALDAKLEERGSWCGETHLQKSVFFLQEMLRVPTGFSYTFYKFGPFSRDLRSELGEMRSDGFLELIPQPAPYGPKLHATDTARRQLLERWPKTLGRFDRHLEFVAEELGSMGVGTLERLATALWVQREMPTSSERSQAERVNELKPHVSVEEATDALRRVAEMEQQAREFAPA